jgi:sarcosine oxidase, subunit gamma
VVELPRVASPLGGLPSPASRVPGIALAEIPFRGKITLRGNIADAGIVAAVREAFGRAPPLRPGTSGDHDGITVLCLAPDEWLVISETRASDLVVRLRAALAGCHAAVVDISCATATIGVSGRRSALLLRKICTIDLARQEVTGRRCWQTRIGPFAVLVDRRREGFELHVARSYARSFWLWLNDATVEFGAEPAVSDSGG